MAWTGAISGRSLTSLQLRCMGIVIISTASPDGYSNPRKSNCWRLQRVGPEQCHELRFLAPVVIGAAYEALFAWPMDITFVE